MIQNKTDPTVGQPFRPKIPPIRKLGTSLSTLSSVLAGVGLVSNYWLIFNTDDISVHSGFFKSCFGSICFSIIESLIQEPIWIIEVLLGVAGIFFMTISTLIKLYTTYNTHPTFNLKLQVSADTLAAALGTACMGALIAVFVFTTKEEHETTYVYGWSLYVFAAGTLGGAASFVLSYMFYQTVQAQSTTVQSMPV